jgi:cell division protease FtsH
MGTALASARMSMDGEDMADSTRRMRDQEQRELADEAYRAAFALIQRHREQLDDLAETLLANEVLERHQIDRIMAGVRPAKPHPTPELGVAAASERPVSDDD